MSESDVIAAMNRVEGELRIARHKDLLKNYPPRLRKVLEETLLEPNVAVRTENLEFIASSLPDGYANRIRGEFTSTEALAQFEALKLNMRTQPQFTPLDSDRRAQLERYRAGAVAEAEKAIDDRYENALQKARDADYYSATKNGRKPPKPGTGLNEMGVLRDIEAAKEKIDVTPQLLRRERELQIERHTLALKNTNPLLGETE